MGILVAGAAYVPGRRRRPGRAGPDWCSARPDVAAVIGNDLVIAARRAGRASARRPRTRSRATTPGSSSPRGRPARRRAWRSRTGRPRRSSTPSRGCSCRTTARARRPGDGRAVGGVRRLVRGDVARLGARRLPGAGTALAGAQRRGRRSVAGRQRHHRRLHRADPGRAVADRGAGRRTAADPGRRGLPARDRRPAGATRAGGVEHLRADRGDRRRLRRPADRRGAGAHRAAARRLGPRRRRRARRARGARARRAS